MTSELRPCCDCSGTYGKVVKTKDKQVYMRCKKCGAKSNKYDLEALLHNAVQCEWHSDMSLEQTP